MRKNITLDCMDFVILYFEFRKENTQGSSMV